LNHLYGAAARGLALLVEQKAVLLAADKLALIFGGEDLLEDAPYLLDLLVLTSFRLSILVKIAGKVKVSSRLTVEDEFEELAEEEFCLVEKAKVLLELRVVRFAREGGEEITQVMIEKVDVLVDFASKVHPVYIEFEGADIEANILVEVEYVVVEVYPLTHAPTIGTLFPLLDRDLPAW